MELGTKTTCRADRAVPEIPKRRWLRVQCSKVVFNSTHTQMLVWCQVAWGFGPGLLIFRWRVVAPSLSPPPNASFTGSVHRGRGASPTDLENPTEEACASWEASLLVLSTSHRPMGSRPPLGLWWQGRGERKRGFAN